ncbi:MAG: hypothetical protein KDA61_09170 [Planctomycetales bacterium]|nr:hypothetical protein [Planctomycetales bacterium]
MPPLLDLDLSDPAQMTTSTSAPAPGGPIVDTDDYEGDTTAMDYSVVDEPPLPAIALEASQPTALYEDEAVVSPEASDASPRVDVASHGALALNPPVQTSTPTPPAPVLAHWKSRVDVGQLVAVRDRLLSFLQDARNEAAALEAARQAEAARAAEAAAQAQASASRAPIRVRVESSDDRLAMATPRVPTLAPPLAVEPTPADIPTPITPTPASNATAPAWDPSTDEVALRSPRYQGPALARRPTELRPRAADPSILVNSSSSCRCPRPSTLHQQLLAAGPSSETTAWRDRVLEQLAEFERVGNDDERAAEILKELAALTSQGIEAATKARIPADQRAWMRACRALGRRLPLWKTLTTAELAQQAAAPLESSGELVRASLSELNAMLGDSTHSNDWREYLLLDDLADLASVGGEEHTQKRREAARAALVRMSSAELDERQREFLAKAPCVALASHLRGWAVGPVDLGRLATIVERYEAEPLPHDADAIAEAVLRLQWSETPALVSLAQSLNDHYRNANVRFAVSETMLNRFLPQDEVTVAPVHDRVAGADVHGQSQITTQLQFHLHAHAEQWLLELEARGRIHSRTYSEAWPARLRNAGHMEFQAHKLIRVSREGVDSMPAEARARGTTSLVDVDTQFDPLPLVGDLFQGMARQRHRERQPIAAAQAKSKVAIQARNRLDSETTDRLARLDEKFRQSILGPLESLALVAEPVDMHTTAQRAVMRLRMADVEQLAAYTPRPSAPSDSLASFQLHESALNNAAAGLGLDGRRMTVDELYSALAGRLQLAETTPPEDLPHRAVIEFAAHDAVHLRCDGDQIRLTLSIAELALGRDSIRQVQVHANFRPEIDGLGARLVRDGALEFEGPRLRTGSRMVLHGVFNKLIRKDHPLELIAANLKEDPRWQGLMVTQLVIEDGWVALALGPAYPERTAWRTGPATQIR